jgi:hypothetical protein
MKISPAPDLDLNHQFLLRDNEIQLAHHFAALSEERGIEFSNGIGSI